MSSRPARSRVPPSPGMPRASRASGAALSARQLYSLLRLRVDVFVVEQRCPYAELDGLDLAPGTEHLWIEGSSAEHVVASLRLLSVGRTRRIGRVATAASHRGRGYAAALLWAALDQIDDGQIVLEAQAHLEQWYAGFGFVRDGSDYVEDGIPHVPMRYAP